MKSMSFKLTYSDLSSANDYDSGLLVLDVFGSCSVSNSSIIGLCLSMFVSVILGVFFASSLKDCVDVEIIELCLNLSDQFLCLDFGLAIFH